MISTSRHLSKAIYLDSKGERVNPKPKETPIDDTGERITLSKKE